MAFVFQSVRENFCEVAKTTLLSMKSNYEDTGPPTQALQDVFAQATGTDAEKKSAMDQAFRDALLSILKREGKREELLCVVTLCGGAYHAEICPPACLFILLQDIFDCSTLDKCEEVFVFLEDRVAQWTSETYYAPGKNYLLRMCNDLLRRLSRLKNTVFCGRIQMFLARLFPLSEKSGLNIMSQFNLENVTIFNTKPEEYDPVRKDSIDEKDESMEFEEGETADHPSNIPIDYNLYRKFWSLQDYFRSPTQCYIKSSWKTFTSYSEDVLTCFESYKLEDSKSQSKSSKDDRKKAMEVDEASMLKDFVYFSKYLTSEKLLDLQLSDSNFRRSMMAQLLVIFQYLQAPVRLKSPTQVLDDEQAAWVKETTQRVFKALRETHPDGDKFANTVEHVLSREENWNSWKNDNCPNFMRATTSKDTIKIPNTRKRTLGDDMKASGGKLIKMGNSELTRLWNLCPDNMTACRTENRVILPSLEEFFEESIEQMDPEAMIEDEYKLIKNPTYAWKSLRLLSRRSPNFFSQPPNAAQKKRSVPEYLEAMLAKLAKEMPSSQAESEIKTEVEDGVDQESGESGEQDDQLGDGNDKNGAQATRDECSMQVSKEQLQACAKKLAGDWKKLAAELDFPDEDITYLESETNDKELQAIKMLTLWKENESEPLTVETVRSALKEIGLEAMATEVFGDVSE